MHWSGFSDQPEFICDYDNVYEIMNGKVIKFNKQDNRKTKIAKYKDIESIYSGIQSFLAVSSINAAIEFEISFENDSLGKMSNIQFEGISDIKIRNKLLDVLKGFYGLPVYYKNGKMISNYYKSKFELLKE